MMYCNGCGELIRSDQSMSELNGRRGQWHVWCPHRRNYDDNGNKMTRRELPGHPKVSKTNTLRD